MWTRPAIWSEPGSLPSPLMVARTEPRIVALAWVSAFRVTTPRAGGAVGRTIMRESLPVTLARAFGPRGRTASRAFGADKVSPALPAREEARAAAARKGHAACAHADRWVAAGQRW